jgi:hypothetical protein
MDGKVDEGSIAGYFDRVLLVIGIMFPVSMIVEDDQNLLQSGNPYSRHWVHPSSSKR